MSIESGDLADIEDGQSAGWTRARRPEQVEERRKAIFDAATEIFDEREYSDITLQAIADRAGFTKSNLYRYFSSREEIYLALYMDEWRAWATRLDRVFSGLSEASSSERIAAAIVDTMLESERLLWLMPLLAISLERNSGEEALVSFKLELAEVSNALCATMARVIPDLDTRRAKTFLGAVHALAAGLWPASQPNATLSRVLERPELSGLCVDFRKTMTTSVSALISGLRSNRDEKLNLNIVRRI